MNNSIKYYIGINKSNLKGIEVVVYEPALKDNEFSNSKVIKDLEEFKSISDLIVSNRLCKDLSDVQDKVYTRDLYNRD